MPGNINRAVRLCGLSALIAAAAGCQRGPVLNLAAVEGTITGNGRPLSHVEVVFLPDLGSGTEGPRSVAVTDEAGRYRLLAHNGETGVVVGKHRVVIHDMDSRRKLGGPHSHVPPQDKAGARAGTDAAERPKVQPQPAMPVRASRVPPNCAEFDKTPLRVEVQSGAQVVDFDVKGTAVEIKLAGGPAQ